MRVLLVVGGIALGILLVAASHQDQAEDGIEAKDERVQDDFVIVRETRSTRGKNKERIKVRPTGMVSMYSVLSGSRLEKEDLVKEREIRSTGGNRRENKVRPTRKPGMYSPFGGSRVKEKREVRSTGGNRRERKGEGKPSWLTPLSGLLPGKLKGNIRNDRAIRSTGGSKKKSKLLRKSPGVYSPLARPSKTKRSVKDLFPQQGRLKKCIGCYTSLDIEDTKDLPPLRRRQQRETEDHEKLKKRRKHRKDKKKSKRKHKHHKHRDAHLETEDPEPEENNNKRPKHIGKRRKGLYHPGGRSAIISVRSTEKTNLDNHNMEDITE